MGLARSDLADHSHNHQWRGLRHIRRRLSIDDSRITAAQRAERSSRAVIYALDGVSGKELWNSGATITSFARGGALSGGVGQIYFTTYDGTIYAFGFQMEH
jgi:outer membrane protein assembly factor BamB